MPAPRTRRRAAFPAMVRKVGVIASAVLLGVGSAILMLATPSARTSTRARARELSGSASAGTAQPVTPVVTRSELPPRIAGGFAPQSESADAQSHAA